MSMSLECVKAVLWVGAKNNNKIIKHIDCC